MALLRRILSDGLSEDECGYDHPCALPSPSPPAAFVNATDFAHPPALLRVPSTRINIEGKNHSLPMVVITIASVLAACFLLLTVYAFLRALLSRCRRRRGAAVLATGGPPQPPFDIDDSLQQDLLASLGGGDELYHVWYIRTEGLDEPTIGAISVCTYKRGEGLVEGTNYAICLGEFGRGSCYGFCPSAATPSTSPASTPGFSPTSTAPSVAPQSSPQPDLFPLHNTSPLPGATRVLRPLLLLWRR